MLPSDKPHTPPPQTKTVSPAGGSALPRPAIEPEPEPEPQNTIAGNSQRQQPSAQRFPPALARLLELDAAEHVARPASRVSTAATQLKPSQGQSYAVEPRNGTLRSLAEETELSGPAYAVKSASAGITVTFTQPGSLGLKFSQSKQTGQVVVLGISAGTQAESHKQLKPGLALLRVGGTSVLGMPLMQAIETIKGAGRPLTCTFGVSSGVPSAAPATSAAMGRHEMDQIDSDESAPPPPPPQIDSDESDPAPPPPQTDSDESDPAPPPSQIDSDESDPPPPPPQWSQGRHHGEVHAARNVELSARARLATEQALSRLVLHAQRTKQNELGACATVGLQFLLMHGASCLSAGAGHALEMLLEPLMLALTTSGSTEMMALALPAVHRLLPYVNGVMLATQIPTAEGFPFLATVIESLAEGVSFALSFHGVGVLLHQFVHALSIVFGMMAPHHLPRDTLSMLVLALFRIMLRASAAASIPAGATLGSLPLSELLAPTTALFRRLGATTFGWLADTTEVSSATTADRSNAAGNVDWVQLEDSVAAFVSKPPAGGPGLLGDGVLTDATVDGWLSTMKLGITAGRPALQLIAALGKLMMYEMPEPVMAGGAPSSVSLARQQALAAGLFGSLLTENCQLAEQLSKHSLCLQVIRRHGMVGLLHAATPGAAAFTVGAAAINGTGCTNSRPEEASAHNGLLAAVSLAIRRLSRSIWLEEVGLLGEEIGAVLSALVKVTLPPALGYGTLGSAYQYSSLHNCTVRLALEQLWLPLVKERHKDKSGRLVILSLFARHDLPHAETSRLFGEPSLLISKQLLGALCALAACGDRFEEQDRSLNGTTGAGALAFDCLCRLVEEIHGVVFAEQGLLRSSQDQGGGGSTLAAWKAGSERCAIWNRVRSMLAEGRNEAALHLTALYMLDEKRPRSKLSDDEHRARVLSWWMLSKAYACQLDVRKVLTLVEKEIIQVGGGDTAQAECFRRLQRRALLPIVEVERSERAPRYAVEPQGSIDGTNLHADPVDDVHSLEISASSDEDSVQDERFDENVRAQLVAAAARQAALGTATVRCTPKFRRHRGLPPGPLPARRLVVLETESGSSAGVALAMFASIGGSVAAAMTETISRQSRKIGGGIWVRPPATKCLAQAEELAACVVAVEDAFASAHESAHGLQQIHADVVAAQSTVAGMRTTRKVEQLSEVNAATQRIGPLLVEQLARERRKIRTE